MVIGLLTIAAGSYWMSQMNLSIGPWNVVWPRVVVIVGLSLIFAPLNVAAFLYIPRELRGSAVGLLALLRNEGGSVGTSLAQTFLQRREQFHTLRLNESLDPLNPAVREVFQQGKEFFVRHTGDPQLSAKLTLRALQNLRDQQALSLAYFDIFWVSAALSILLVPLVLLMRRSVAEKGAHVIAE
jgi:DHA2 family multidrug resistance protein